MRAHEVASGREARERAIALLERVGIADAQSRYSDYPHELSGGIAQRVLVAVGLSCEPDLLILDEPTTGLDVTIQAQLLELLEELASSFETAIQLVTHDLGVVAECCDRVLVMYGGRAVERAPVEELFYDPAHPYTAGLLASIPRIGRIEAAPVAPRRPAQPDSAADRLSVSPALSVRRGGVCDQRTGSRRDRDRNRCGCDPPGSRRRLPRTHRRSRGRTRLRGSGRRRFAGRYPRDVTRRKFRRATMTGDDPLLRPRASRNGLRRVTGSSSGCSDAARRSARSTASTSRSRRARRWDSSVRVAVGRRRSGGSSSASTSRPRARSSTGVETSRRSIGASDGSCGRTSSTSFRIRSRASTHSFRSATSSANRSRSRYRPAGSTRRSDRRPARDGRPRALGREPLPT